MDKDGVYRCSWTAPVAPANSHGGGVTGQFPHYGPGEVQRGRSRLSAQESGSLPLPPPPIARDPVAAAEICLGAQGCWQPLGTRRQHCRLANPAPPYPQGGAPRPRQPGHSRGTHHPGHSEVNFHNRNTTSRGKQPRERKQKLYRSYKVAKRWLLLLEVPRRGYAVNQGQLLLVPGLGPLSKS